MQTHSNNNGNSINVKLLKYQCVSICIDPTVKFEAKHPQQQLINIITTCVNRNIKIGMENHT